MTPMMPSNSQLRELLNPKEPASLDGQVLISSSSDVVASMLNASDSVESYEKTKQELSTLYDGLKCILDVADVPPELQQRQFLNKTGLAMSPQHALTTINDVLRVSAFVRAIHRAIGDLKQRFNKPLHIVYPACGPLAPLLMPLLAYYKHQNIYSADDLSVTLIDIQQGAVMSLQKLFHASGLDCYIREIICADAVDYHKPPNQTIHLVILEAMQHGFSTEGHLAIAMHFARLLDNHGIFLPQKISIEAVLSSGQREFVDQWHDQQRCRSVSTNNVIINERIRLGTVLEITRQSLLTLEKIPVDEFTSLIHCSNLKIPDFEQGEQQKVLLFCCRIDIYGDEVINEYDSGITHPFPDLNICINFVPKADLRDDDLLVRSGDTLGFFYRMNGMPGFLVTRQDHVT